MTIDITDTIKSSGDQLNADDLIGGPKFINITSVKVLGGDQPLAIQFEGDGGKPYLPSKSMRRVLAFCWGNEASVWVGRWLKLYRDPDVTYAGQKVGGIKISHLSDLDAEEKTLMLQASKQKKAPHSVKLLKPKGTAKKETKKDEPAKQPEAPAAAAEDDGGLPM